VEVLVNTWKMLSEAVNTFETTTTLNIAPCQGSVGTFSPKFIAFSLVVTTSDAIVGKTNKQTN